MKRGRTGKQVRQMSAVLISLLLALVLGLTVTIIYVHSLNSEIHARSFDWSIDTMDDEDILVVATPGSYWLDGDKFVNQYDVSIYNYSDFFITNWQVNIVVPDNCTLDNSWNGIWSLEGGKLSCVPEDFNSAISSHSNSAFGVVMTSSQRFEMNEISIEYTREKKVIMYPVFWILASLIFIILVILITSAVIQKKMENFEKNNMVYKDLVNESLRTIANIIDTKDEYTKGHSVRVAIYSQRIAEKMGFDEKEQERIYNIGLLHDIGKVGIPQSILTKPGRLSDEEYAIIKRHPALGSTIMKDFSSIPGVQNGVRFHHERYDGKGYNEGIAGTDIPIEGRIICVADSYDAMSSRRCYRNSLSYDFILDEIKRNAGTQFDPEIAACMVELIEAGQAPLTPAEEEEYGI